MAGKSSKASSSHSKSSKLSGRGARGKSNAKSSKSADTNKHMSAGTKVAVGVAAGAAVVGAAAALAGTDRGRKLVKQAAGAARDLANDASAAVMAGERRIMDRARGMASGGSTQKSGAPTKHSRGKLRPTAGASSASHTSGKTAKPVVLAAAPRAGSGGASAVGGFSLGGGSLGGASLGGGMSGGGIGNARTGASNANPFDKRDKPKVGPVTGQSDASRNAVRGHSGHR